MTVRLPRFTTLALLTCLATGVALPAMALEPVDVLERYKAVAENQGQSFTYGAIEGTADNFTAKDPVWSSPGIPPVKAPNVRFSDVSEQDDGSITIGRIEASDLVSDGEAIDMAVENAAFVSFRLPAAGEKDALLANGYYRQFDLQNATFTANGASVATIKSASANLGELSRDKPIDFDFTVEGVSLTLAPVLRPQQEQMLQLAGYDANFTGRVVMKGYVDYAKGDFSIGTYDMTVDEIGTLSVPMTLTGYDADRMAKLQREAQAAAKTGDQKAQQAIGMKMFSDLALKSATVRFTDDSVTDRVLKISAARMNSDPQSVAMMAPLMVGASMAQLKMPELTQMVAAAVGEFLGKPKSIAVAVDPEKPITLTEAMQIAKEDRKALVDRLDLKVVANQ